MSKNHPKPLLSDQTDTNFIGTNGSLNDIQIRNDKELRRDLEFHLQELKNFAPSRERALAITKIEEGIMWLGKDLNRLGNPNPYPNSYNPENSVVDPPAEEIRPKKYKPPTTPGPYVKPPTETDLD